MYYQHFLFYLALLIAGCSLSDQKLEIKTLCWRKKAKNSHQELLHHSYVEALAHAPASVEAGIRAFCSAMGNQDYQGYWPNAQNHRCYSFERTRGLDPRYTLHIYVRSSLPQSFRIPTQRCLNVMCKLLEDCPVEGGKVDYGGHWQVEISAQLSLQDCTPEKGWLPKKNEPLEHCWDPMPGHEPQRVDNPELLVEQGPDICLTSDCLAKEKLEHARRAA